MIHHEPGPRADRTGDVALDDFAGPWAHADEAGVFHDEDGREYRAVDVGGELTFLPLRTS